jgi:nicotinate-nucleotide adenylyltransferase
VSVAAGPQRRIGVFGGAFDPPHIAHVALAKAALEQLQLDELRIIPTGEAWHKTRSLTPAVHRLEMARLAFAGLDRVVVDPRETRRNGPSYTVDTLLELQAEFPEAQLFLVLGEDQAKALATWHRWREIPGLAIICVAARADCAGAFGALDTLISEVPGLQQLKMPPIEVSATEIRQLLANRQNVVPLVFEPVARYIDHHHLYQTA